MKTGASRRLLVALALLGALACGDSEATAPGGSSVVVSPTVAFLVGAGSTVVIRASVGGGLPVTWTSAEPTTWSTSREISLW